MVALRRRTSAEAEVLPVAVPANGAGAVAMDAPSDAAPPSARGCASLAPVAPSDDKETLKRRLAELEAAERNAAQLRQQQAEIQAQMVREQQQPEAPKLSERDLAFIGARPGIDRDPRLAHMANGLEGAGIAYGSNRFYEMLEAAFPLSDYRRAESIPPNMSAPVSAPNGDTPHISPERFAQPESIDARMIAEAKAMEAPEPIQYDGGIHSAPPSRESFSYSTGRATPGRVVLSRDERDLARSCGVSETEWAKGKLKLEARRRAGLLQEGEDR
jgi:hypothetical protein